MDNTENVLSPGCSLILKERIEQIEKHGFTVDVDKVNNNEELVRCAAAILTNDINLYPSWWEEVWWNKIMAKPRLEQIAIAGALCAADLDLKLEEEKLDK